MKISSICTFINDRTFNWKIQYICLEVSVVALKLWKAFISDVVCTTIWSLWRMIFRPADQILSLRYQEEKDWGEILGAFSCLWLVEWAAETQMKLANFQNVDLIEEQHTQKANHQSKLSLYSQPHFVRKRWLLDSSSKKYPWRSLSYEVFGLGVSKLLSTLRCENFEAGLSEKEIYSLQSQRADWHWQ